MAITLSEVPHKWGIIIIDSKKFLGNLIEIISDSTDYCIKSFELCANMTVRNVFTSNLFYGPNDIPKQFSFFLEKKESFLEKYSYVLLGDKTYED